MRPIFPLPGRRIMRFEGGRPASCVWTTGIAGPTAARARVRLLDLRKTWHEKPLVRGEASRASRMWGLPRGRVPARHEEGTAGWRPRRARRSRHTVRSVARRREKLSCPSAISKVVGRGEIAGENAAVGVVASYGTPAAAEPRQGVRAHGRRNAAGERPEAKGVGSSSVSPSRTDTLSNVLEAASAQTCA